MIRAVNNDLQEGIDVMPTSTTARAARASFPRRKCGMESATPVYDKLGRRRSPATLPGFRKGIPNGNRGKTMRGEIYTNEEVMLLISSQNRRAASGLRHRALIALLWRSGLRIQEALDLEIRDINIETCTIHVRSGKGDKERRVAMDAVGWNYLQPWLERRGQLDGVHPDRGVLFCVTDGPTKGNPMGSASVRTMLKRAGEMSGMTKRIHPHGLRHSHAVSCFEEGIDVRVISAQLGHSNMAMTAHYLDHMSPKAQQAAITARPDPFAPERPTYTTDTTVPFAEMVAAVRAAVEQGDDE